MIPASKVCFSGFLRDGTKSIVLLGDLQVVGSVDRSAVLKIFTHLVKPRFARQLLFKCSYYRYIVRSDDPTD